MNRTRIPLRRYPCSELVRIVKSYLPQRRKINCGIGSEKGAPILQKESERKVMLLPCQPEGEPIRRKISEAPSIETADSASSHGSRLSS